MYKCINQIHSFQLISVLKTPVHPAAPVSWTRFAIYHEPVLLQLSPSILSWQLWVLQTTVAPLNPTTSFSNIGRVRCHEVCVLKSQGRSLCTLSFKNGEYKVKMSPVSCASQCWNAAGTLELSCTSVRSKIIATDCRSSKMQAAGLFEICFYVWV